MIAAAQSSVCDDSRSNQRRHRGHRLLGAVRIGELALDARPRDHSGRWSRAATIFIASPHHLGQVGSPNQTASCARPWASTSPKDRRLVPIDASAFPSSPVDAKDHSANRGGVTTKSIAAAG